MYSYNEQQHIKKFRLIVIEIYKQKINKNKQFLNISYCKTNLRDYNTKEMKNISKQLREEEEK